MKKIKRNISLFLVMAIVVLLGSGIKAEAASAKITIGVSSTSPNIGDTLNVTMNINADEDGTVQTSIGYDSNILEYTGSNKGGDCNGGGGKLTLVSNVQNGKAYSITLTFKTIAPGESSISATPVGGMTDATGESINVTGASVRVTVNNAAGGTGNEGNTGNTGENPDDTSNKSADNSLASLTISPGTLSPAFKTSVTSYTASVGSDVNEIAIDAKVSNNKAVVESVTGNKNLKDGQNTIKIVVKAENGTTAVYKIVVTKGGNVQEPVEEPNGEENPDAIVINGHEYDLAETIADDKVIEDFTKTTINCKGKEVEALQFNNGNVVLVYLTTPDTEVKNIFAVYDQESGTIYPFIKVAMGNSYYIMLNAPAETGLPDTYAATTVEMGEYGIAAAYGTPESGEFCLVYAISKDGNTGWYQYDKTEGTLQRYIQQEAETVLDEAAINAEIKGLQNSYDKLEKRYDKEKSFARKTIAVLVFIIAVLIVVIVNLILHRRDKEDEWEDGFSEVPKRFRQKEEPKQNVSKKSSEEKSVKEQAEKPVTVKKTTKPKESEETDDFEVIDLDDL